MDLEKDVEKIENKVEKTSFAMEMLEYSKKQNEQLVNNFHKMVAIWVITFIGLLLAVGYIIFLLNDIGKTTKEIDIEDVEVIDNSHIKIGDDIYQVGEDKWEE